MKILVSNNNAFLAIKVMENGKETIKLISLEEDNLKPENIRKGKTIFGVVGTYGGEDPTPDPDPTSDPEVINNILALEAAIVDLDVLDIQKADFNNGVLTL